MSNTASKTGSGKTTIVLSAILVLLVLFAVIVFWGIPAYRHYYITHIQYPVYGGLTAELKDCEFYEDMHSGKSFCFLGDSITIGTVTDGSPWYQPIIPYFKGAISNVSYPGWTVYDLISNKTSFPDADVYVIAIGVNDILYVNHYADSASEFIDRCNQLVNVLKQEHKNPKIYFISPWPFYGFNDEIVSRGEQFRKELELWCMKVEINYIDPNPIIQSKLSEEGVDKYMYNENHPNSPQGIGLFSYAVLKANHNQRETHTVSAD